MGRKSRLRKIVDDETGFRCAGGVGILREEVWVDECEQVVRYNLAFVLPHLSSIDNGRILGFDNAHEVHERHFMGQVEPVQFNGYPATARRFYGEVDALRKGYKEKQ
jgi:hypothetical protein